MWIKDFIQVLPIIIMVESWLACIPLVMFKQYGSAIYWFCAGFLNFAVIFGIKKWG